MVNFKEYFKIKNYFYFIQGTLRYHIYYKYKFLKSLVPNYIWLQIETRILSMDTTCFSYGVCKLCGCTTTKLQFSDKPCNKPCYPKMLDEKTFNGLYHYKRRYYDEELNIEWTIQNYRFIKKYL